jgi:hypothetical protein
MSGENEEIIDSVMSGEPVTTTETPTPSTDNDVADKIMNDLDDMSRLNNDVATEPKAPKDDSAKGAKAPKDDTKTADDTDGNVRQNAHDQLRAKPDGKKRDLNTQSQQATDQGDRRYRALNTFLKEDENRNLVDNKGNIIAAAGPAREHFEAVKREGREAAELADNEIMKRFQLGQQFKGLYDEFKKMEAAKTTDRLDGIDVTPQEVTMIRDVLDTFKTNPQQAINKVLTYAKMSGTDLSKMGLNDTMDVSAVKTLVEDVVKSNLSPVKETLTGQQEAAKAEAEVQEFLGTFPEARNYIPQLIQAVNRFPDMPLSSAWAHLSKSIRNAQQKHAQTAAQQPPTQQTKTAVPVTRTKPKPSKTPTNASNQSWDDIARQVTQEFG